MRLATYNVASIRARLDNVLEWLAENEPDVLALQETKVEDDKFPIEEFAELGYFVSLNGQKSWNGVALATREPATEVHKGFGDPLWNEDARIISARVGGVQIINTYVPNGSEVGSDKWDYKLRWLDRLSAWFRQRFDPGEPLIWLGDINIAPGPKDVYDPKRFDGKVGRHPDEFHRLDSLRDFGLVDCFRTLHPDAVAHTFWDFVLPNGVDRNLGWRIDHIYATESMASRLQACRVDMAPRLKHKPSDHTVVVADFS